MRKGFVAALIAATLVSGCTRRLGDFTMISSKNVDLTRGADFRRASARVNGKHEVVWILGIPTGIANMKEAMDKAIESTPGSVALVDGVVKYTEWSTILVGVQSYQIEGTPLIDPLIEKQYKR